MANWKRFQEIDSRAPHLAIPPQLPEDPSARSSDPALPPSRPGGAAARCCSEQVRRLTAGASGGGFFTPGWGSWSGSDWTAEFWQAPLLQIQ